MQNTWFKNICAIFLFCVTPKKDQKGGNDSGPVRDPLIY